MYVLTATSEPHAVKREQEYFDEESEALRLRLLESPWNHERWSAKDEKTAVVRGISGINTIRRQFNPTAFACTVCLGNRTVSWAPFFCQETKD